MQTPQSEARALLNRAHHYALDRMDESEGHQMYLAQLRRRIPPTVSDVRQHFSEVREMLDAGFNAAREATHG